MKKAILVLVMILCCSYTFLPAMANKEHSVYVMASMDEDSPTPYFLVKPYLKNYATDYFNALSNNFGANEKNSCGYVALGMLLSFYDSYWDDDVIPENYDKQELSLTDKFATGLKSPGISNEAMLFSGIDMKTINNIEYYKRFVEVYSDTYFHLKLIQLGNDILDVGRLDGYMISYGLSPDQVEDLTRYYLFQYRHYLSADVTVESRVANSNTSSDDVRKYVVQKVKQGIPVLVSMSGSPGGHALVIYDYDEANDELYGNLGYIRQGAPHASISAAGYDVFLGALTLDFKNAHNCSDNYYYKTDGNTHTLCTCTKHMHPAHAFSYKYVNSSVHQVVCACGTVVEKSHAVDGNYIPSGNGRFKPCYYCRVELDTWSKSYPIMF